MHFQLRTLTLRIDWLMLLFPCFLMLLDGGRTTTLLLLSLSAHEFAHWAMAQAVHLKMTSIRLTPFGGLSAIENPYGAASGRLCAVASAGPAANLTLLLWSAALCRWSLLSPFVAAELIRINAALMLFNLTPALPLDGGRILFALLARYIRESAALRICIWSGRAVAAILILLALAGVLLYRQLNLSFLFAAVFILISAEDERRALSDCRLRSMLATLAPLTNPMPAELIAVDASVSPQDALRAARPNRVTLFAVYKDGMLHEITDNRALVWKILGQS